MKKILLLLPLLFNVAFAGEPHSRGFILREDSYVFTMDEAKDLRLNIKNLEDEIAHGKKEIIELKNLSSNRKFQLIESEELVELKKLQIDEYKLLHELDTERIDKLQKQANISTIEMFGLVSLGIGVTVGAILIADKIDDSIEKTSPTTQQENDSGLTLRF